MSDYLQAASFIHAGKDWPFNASNHLKQIKIESPGHNFLHLVYSMPRKFMRSNAATFGDWQKNEEGSQKSQARKQKTISTKSTQIGSPQEQGLRN